ncbi:hypothetical protein MTP99_019029 [Tenebrio molitor]|nr:hypothetical protein MTP99_019029 [Tenebrio molitor]
MPESEAGVSLSEMASPERDWGRVRALGGQLCKMGYYKCRFINCILQVTGHGSHAQPRSGSFPLRMTSAREDTSRKAWLSCNNYIFIVESDQTAGIFAIMIFDLDPHSLISTVSYVRSIGNPYGCRS